MYFTLNSNTKRLYSMHIISLKMNKAIKASATTDTKTYTNYKTPNNTYT